MQEHGSFELSLCGQILIIKAYDSWNVETATRFAVEYKKLALQICDRPWVELVDLSQWFLGTPEIWSQVDSVNEWSNQNNKQYEAVIYCLSLQEALLKRSEISLSNVESAFFKNEKDARAWLFEKGFN